MTIIVVRLLNPEDYGLMSMAAVVIAFLMLVNEIGVGPAIVQRASISRDLLRQAFGIAISCNLLLLVVLWLATPAIAAFFGEPQLVSIIRTLSLQFLIIPFATLPSAMLVRDLNFKRKSIVELTANVAGGATSLILAIQGLGVWSLVWGSLVLMVMQSVGYMVSAPCFVRPSLSYRGAKDILTFGALITTDRLLWFFYSRADVVIVGKILGSEVLGFYAVAMQLASLPMQKVNAILNDIAFPAFSKVQMDIEKISQYITKAIRVVSLIAFPVFLGISAVSQSFVNVVLGVQWIDAALPLAILAWIMPLRMISNLITSALQGIGKVGVSVGNLVYAAVLIPAALLIGTQWGVIGVCWAWSISFPIVTCIEIWRSRSYIGMGFVELSRSIIRPLTGSVLMWVGVTLLSVSASENFVSPIGLLLLVSVGVAIYAVSAFFTDRRVLKEAMSLMQP